MLKLDQELIFYSAGFLVPDLDDLGLVRETLIFKTWNILDLIG